MSTGSLSRVRVVTIGGGTGSSILLRGLKRFAHRLDTTAIVTTFDDGGSSGRLRKEFGAPAFGDLRRCVVALMPSDTEEAAIQRLLDHRFTSEGPLRDHSLGNLMLLGMWQQSENLSNAIDALSNSLQLLGRVIPVSDQFATLCAELDDGSIARGEASLDTLNQTLFGHSKLYLDPPVAANPAALDAILMADLLIMGPGDLFTSVIPNLLPEGLSGAIKRSTARVLQICNTKYKSGETGDYVASDFAVALNRYLNSIEPTESAGDRRVDAMIVNGFTGNSQKSEGAIEIDSRLNEEVETVLVRRVSNATDMRVHDSDRLATAVMEYIDAVIN